MLYHLFEYLQRIGLDFPGERLMNYISFRAICCSIVAILTSMLVGKKIIATLQKKQIGETIRDLGLEGQLQKKGTPTMGGIIILISILIPILLFAGQHQHPAAHPDHRVAGRAGLHRRLHQGLQAQ